MSKHEWVGDRGLCAVPKCCAVRGGITALHPCPAIVPSVGRQVLPIAQGGSHRAILYDDGYLTIEQADEHGIWSAVLFVALAGAVAQAASAVEYSVVSVDDP